MLVEVSIKKKYNIIKIMQYLLIKIPPSVMGDAIIILTNLQLCVSNRIVSMCAFNSQIIEGKDRNWIRNGRK